jgi:hypothetical protein
MTARLLNTHSPPPLPLPKVQQDVDQLDTLRDAISEVAESRHFL